MTNRATVDTVRTPVPTWAPGPSAPPVHNGQLPSVATSPQIPAVVDSLIPACEPQNTRHSVPMCHKDTMT